MDLDCYVSGALAAVLRLSRVAGVAPLNFVKEGTGWRISVSSGWRIYSNFVIGVISMMAIGSFIFEMQIDTKLNFRLGTYFRRALWFEQVLLTVAVTWTVVYGALEQMRYMIAYISQVQKINTELEIYDWSTSMSWERKKTALFIGWSAFNAAMHSLELMQMIITVKTSAWHSLINSFFCCCAWIVLMQNMKFIMITLHIKYSFTAVNDKLRTLLHGEMTKPVHSYHKTVHRLALTYASICKVVRGVDRSQGLIMLCILGYTTINLIYMPYYLITGLIAGPGSQSFLKYVLYSALQVYWCFSYLLTLVMIVEPCQLTVMEMESTRVLVSQLMRCTHSVYDPLALELDWFYRHLMLNDVSYKPMKVASLTRALVITILGTVTTYLVIVIELETP